jgi:hypothetical protein
MGKAPLRSLPLLFMMGKGEGYFHIAAHPPGGRANRRSQDGDADSVVYWQQEIVVSGKELVEMKVLAVITDPSGCVHPLEVHKILECLKRNKAPPFEKVALKVS